MDGNNIVTIRPFLTVNNGKKAVDFYIDAFGAIETKRFEMPDLKLNSPVRIVLQTKNADELFEKAIKFGATQICPMTTEKAWRIGKLKDPFGHVWEIGYVLND